LERAGSCTSFTKNSQIVHKIKLDFFENLWYNKL
jgi:hypothetical protein